jgi:K+-dependent Na+/Ca+ exchanger-like protein
VLPYVDALPNPWRPLVYVLVFLVGLVLLERGADALIDASAALARRLHAPQTLVGLLTAGGEWEELVVVLAAVIGGHRGIALGDILGSTIANILGSFSLGLLGRKPLIIERSARLYAVALVVVTLLVSGLLVAGPIGSPAGAALVVLFAVYLATILLALRRGLLNRSSLPAEDDDADDADEEREAIERWPLPAQLGVVALGLAVVSLGAYLVVEPAVYFAHALGLSQTVIGLTIVAIGTTLPDKAISFVGGRRGHGGVVVANAVGSNIFLLTLVLGLAAFAGPLGVDAATLRFDVPVMVGCAVALCLLVFRGRLHWRTGVALLALYAGYLAYQFIGK